jgi:hypothetical protein
MVQVPEEVYQAYLRHTPGARLSRTQAEALGYPSVPGERELERVRKDLKEALGRCDWDQAHDLDHELRELQERVAAMRVTALRPSAIRA